MSADSSIALITTDEAKTYLGVSGSSEDGKLDNLVNECSALANSYCGRWLAKKTHTEYYNGNGQPELILKHYPIRSITSLHVADANRNFNSSEEIASTDRISFSDSGIIRLWNEETVFLFGHANVKIVYIAGWDQADAPKVPYDVELAIKKWVAQNYMKQIHKRHDVQSISIGEQTTTYSVTPMPEDVKAALDPFRMLFNPPDFAFAE